MIGRQAAIHQSGAILPVVNNLSSSLLIAARGLILLGCFSIQPLA